MNDSKVRRFKVIILPKYKHASYEVDEDPFVLETLEEVVLPALISMDLNAHNPREAKELALKFLKPWEEVADFEIYAINNLGEYHHNDGIVIDAEADLDELINKLTKE